MVRNVCCTVPVVLATDRSIELVPAAAVQYVPTTSTELRRTTQPSIVVAPVATVVQLPAAGCGDAVSNEPLRNACSTTVADSAENSEVFPPASVAVATIFDVPAVSPVIDSKVAWNAPFASVVICPSQRLPCAFALPSLS